MAKALAKRGVPAESFEISRSLFEDITSAQFIRNFTTRINTGILAVWIGITCASYSRARRGNPDYSGWPPPLRSDDSKGIWGLPGLSVKDADRVRLGNRLVKRCIQVISICAKHGIPVFLENPRNSRIWLIPPLLTGLKKHHRCG